MDNLKKYFSYENFLYLILLMAPFLDAIGFIFREIYPSAAISPATVIRPIIPLGLLIYIFFKEKKLCLPMIGVGIIYVIYGIIHMLIYKELITGISFGSMMHEAQYIINYTYMMGVFFIFYYGNKNYNLKKLPAASFIMLIIYLFLIYLSIITNTSSNTYIEGIGYKGWFTSGNAIGSILLCLFCISLPYIQKSKNKIMGIITFLFLGVFLMLLLGTRTGLFGFILCTIVFVIANIFIKFMKKINLRKTKNEMIILGVVILLSMVILLIGSNTFKRQQNLDDMSNAIKDPNTGDVAHVSGDILKIINNINDNKVTDEYISEPQKESVLDLYEYANEHKIRLTDRRRLQLIYHVYLIENQHDIRYILFGNGYLTNFSELTLEMEFLALLFNFGIIGFSLYLLPFIIVYLKSLKYFIKNIKHMNIEWMMYLFAFTLALGLSFLAGYTFFNPSSMAIIVVINVLLINKIKGSVKK